MALNYVLYITFMAVLITSAFCAIKILPVAQRMGAVPPTTTLCNSILVLETPLKILTMPLKHRYIYSDYWNVYDYESR